MVAGVDSQTRKFLTDLQRITNRVDTAQRQITSGKRINQISDAPDDISHLLAIRSDLSLVSQTTSNLGRVKTEVDTAESTLSHAVQLLDRIQVLGTQGASDLAGKDARRTLASEIEQVTTQLVNLSNTQLEGRYLFSGDSDQSVAYTVDFTQPDPISAFLGTPTTREVQHPAGPRFKIAHTAQEIFESTDPASNVFDNVLALRSALLADDSSAIGTALSHVRSAGTHLNNELAAYGGFQNAVDEAIDFGQKQQVRLNQQISEVEDADVTAAILELRESQFHRDTALSAQGSRSRRTLFDYLR